VTTYRDAFRLFLARFGFALTAGVPFGALLHTIFWAFLLKGEKALASCGAPTPGLGIASNVLPQPIVEWTLWLILFGSGALTASMVASFAVYDGFMSSTTIWVIGIMMAIMAAVALTAAYFTGRSLLTSASTRRASLTPAAAAIYSGATPLERYSPV